MKVLYLKVKLLFVKLGTVKLLLKRLAILNSHHLCSECDTIHKVTYTGLFLKPTPHGWLFFPLNDVSCDYCGAEITVVTLHTDETGRTIAKKYERLASQQVQHD